MDTSAPSDPALSYGSFTNATVNGGVVWYRPGAASGQFQVTASSSDTHSGVAAYGFPAAASGWSISGSGSSRTYSHSGAPANPAEPNEVFATNGAGLNSNNTAFTVTPDSTAPSVTAPSVTAGYYTSLAVPVSLNGGSDSESGLAAGSSIVQRDEAPLDNGDGSCDAFPGSWSTVALSGGNDTTVVSGKCYRYRELLSDRVGNQDSSGASNTAKVDTSAPAAPSLSYGSLADAAVTGDTVYYRPSAGSGQFQVAASSSDVQSGIASYGFPAVASGWSVSGSGASRTYSHSGAPTDPAEPLDVTSVNGAGLNSAASGFTVTPDGSAPSGISASVTGGYYTALSVAVTLDNGSDTGSGIDAASGIVERDETPLDNSDGSCDAFAGSWSQRHAFGRQRHERRQRQVLPLPLPPLRPRRQPGVLGRQCYREGRHLRPRRAEPHLRLTHQCDLESGRRLLPPERGEWSVRGHRELGRRPVGDLLLQLRGRGLGLERLRLGRHAHLQPLRLAERSGRAERRVGDERCEPDFERDELHRHAGWHASSDHDPM